ncbi:MAG TPA: hypothetical protein VGQ46_08725 [Thermoanaerobaculia bacterium]|nr:hypothetical protein [Thermoanaerobaculia bacterium]
MTAPVMAAPRDPGVDPGFFARAKSFITHILDVVESKLTFPPG